MLAPGKTSQTIYLKNYLAFKALTYLHLALNRYTLSNLRELRWLFLRQCSCLEELPKLQAFTNIEVLDLCGAASLRRFQDKNSAPLQKLQILDLSNTRIERLPIFHDPKRYPFLKDLRRLLLSVCNHLARLPSLKPLSGLQIVDLSGANMLKEFSDESFEKNDVLKILDLSGTSISQLSFDDLKLRGYSRLEELPCTTTLTDIELLDLSNASSLERFRDKSFEHLKLLRYLNLSNTKVTHLPSLSRLHNLRELLLRNCVCVKKLQNVNQLKRLEFLDLSGCRSLTEIQEGSFEQMPRLQTLNLSETKVKFLPSLCGPGNLCHLQLRNCTSLEKLFPLESLSKLEVLDLSGSRSLSEIKAESFEG
ncbi:leucine-rich transmembrane proteins, putative [Ricinus communis]|uniref:Leucine-rich transmembrane proteins, putative n=1 Tax=Ricinus communis TaxID=3988 RepID=B9S1J4_RICCO|nr:leucine-rich transmembrane proteins, putative [Ricinus communis]